MRGDPWTDDRIAMLRRLWAEGETAAAIADRLGGISRSAVMGKVFRLRLPTAGSAKALPEGACVEQASTPARRRRRIKRIRRPYSVAAAAARHKALLELTNAACRWPYGHPGTDGFFFCGTLEANLERGIPYCRLHMCRAYGPSVRVEAVNMMTPHARAGALAVTF